MRVAEGSGLRRRYLTRPPSPAPQQIGHAYGVTESPGISILSRGHSYEVTESPGISVLSRGYSYGVTKPPAISVLSRGHSGVTPQILRAQGYSSINISSCSKLV
jgi:hypothetical protein